MRRGRGHTGYEDIFVWGADELHGFVGEESHVFIDGVVGDVGVGAVIEGDEDVEEDYNLLSAVAPITNFGGLKNMERACSPTITTKVNI